ncbi:hypothetical protein SASPL_115654 [Salvia splendens]|uniref:Solute carrier family 15 (Peptide/histidine transporter), member 3/4 n=1 Tax=Salvia splendens TaxID=180675 RepID=A0A8X8Y6Z1_SALSN|nr:protein NRT1/ PTR FAMILY 4.3-like [Salvia splendens]KAG6425227.1 hypothetical protein SASPL_115654 [Salvia splendens]
MEASRREQDLKEAVKVCEESSLDWRGKPSNPQKHGGMRAAAFLLGLQGFEIMAIAAVGNNLITYVINEMHFSLSKAANIVTNFIGTLFILSLLGGFLSDSYLGCFWTTLIFGFIELSGLILLSVQAHLPELKPPPCDMVKDSAQCVEAKGLQALTFFVALYLVALGSGCVKPNMVAHGADQFNQDDPKQSKKLSSYFNAIYFAFSLGELVALTLLVYVQTHSGMDIGFGVSAASMAMGLIIIISGTLLYRNKPPRGSVLTPIAQVIVAATRNRKHVCPSDNTISDSFPNSQPTLRFRLLNKACMKKEEEESSKWRVCSVKQVEQVKTLISVLPILCCTIIFNTILAQLQTFSVQQGAAMNTRLSSSSSFHIPPASLQAIPYLILIFAVPLYDAAAPRSITPLRRLGAGLLLSTFSMVAAALVERKRRDSGNNDLLSIWWIAPQFVIFGVSEMLTAVGLVEFFYKQPLEGMRASLTAVTYCSYSFGFFLSSVLVSVVDGATGWLSDNDLDKDRLDLFYWLLAVLSFLNFLNYLFWANWYSSGVIRVGGDGDSDCVV